MGRTLGVVAAFEDAVEGSAATFLVLEAVDKDETQLGVGEETELRVGERELSREDAFDEDEDLILGLVEGVTGTRDNASKHSASCFVGAGEAVSVRDDAGERKLEIDEHEVRRDDCTISGNWNDPVTSILDSSLRCDKEASVIPFEI